MRPNLHTEYFVWQLPNRFLNHVTIIAFAKVNNVSVVVHGIEYEFQGTLQANMYKCGGATRNYLSYCK